MDQSSEEPTNKKLKTDDTKCCSCKITLRSRCIKIGKKITNKADAETFFKSYGFFVQVNDVVCVKCFSKLRLKKCETPTNKFSDDYNQSSFSEITNLPEQTANSPISTLNLSQALSEFSMDEDVAEKTSSQIPTQFSQESKQDSTLTNEVSSEHSEYYPSEELEFEEIELVTMPFGRVIFSKAYCFICGEKSSLMDVPMQARLQVFTKRRLFIPKRNRCCSRHLIKTRFYENEIPVMTVYSKESIIDAREIKDFIGKLSDQVDVQLHDKIRDISLSEERVKTFTGYSWDTIFKIQELLKSMRQSSNRSILQALVIFLLKLKSGNSNALIAAILDVSEWVVENSINSILKCFKEQVLPDNFGVAAHNREFFLQEQAKAVELLYGRNDTLYVISDGTYLRHQKSSNNAYQRKSYSGHKKVPLCKPFTICTTNGYIIDLTGPFEGTINDATILERSLQDPNGLINILKKGDVFILDRGFRDIKDTLEEKGFKVLMPALKGNRKQLTTEESNESRYVTKLRWVVEAKHGIIGQKYKLLHHQFQNKSLPNAETYCKAACLLENLFGKRLNSDDNDLEQIIERMKERRNLVNHLADMVTHSNYNQKSVPFKKISSTDLLDFPELSIKQLELFFTGSYQLQQAISYLGEMLDDNNTLLISYLKEDPGVVRFEVRSRHINSRTYKCYVQYDQNGEGINAIKGYCCNCSNGLRTIGCCSHVAALVYHLSHGRYLSAVIRPASILTQLFNIDNVCPVIDEDSDED